MAHFAQIDHNNIVTQVIVIEPEVLALGHWGDPNSWIQTSYNTRAGIHYGPDGQPDDKPPLRKNYAGVGYSYDAVRDAFVPPQPYASWLLDETTCTWTAPVAYPQDNNSYQWSETAQSWQPIVVQE